jgi:sulfite reductase subunit B
VEKRDLYTPRLATITKIDDLTELEKRFHLEFPDKSALGHKPGQFVEVSIFGFGEAPISVSSSPTVETHFELTVRRTGKLTDKMHTLKVGDTLGIRGPFGNGFDVEKLAGKDMLFVCGGIGLAPLKSLIDYTIAKRSDFGKLTILYGTKTEEEILFKSEIAAWQMMDDVDFRMTLDNPSKSWSGNKGVITTLIPPLSCDPQNTIAAIVGPPVMYKFVLLSLQGKKWNEDNIYMSLERRMKCGVGKCGHCQINSSYVCQDGPVYHYPTSKKLEEAI